MKLVKYLTNSTKIRIFAPEKVKMIIRMREGAEFRELMLQVVRTRMAFRRSMQRTLKKNNAGITFEMLQVLSSLWHEQGISQQILAERIAKDKACLTNLMNNLEKKGYVCRKEDPNDRRNKESVCACINWGKENRLNKMTGYSLYFFKNIINTV